MERFSYHHDFFRIVLYKTQRLYNRYQYKGALFLTRHEDVPHNDIYDCLRNLCS
jgi:hypothetical protein